MVGPAIVVANEFGDDVETFASLEEMNEAIENDNLYLDAGETFTVIERREIGRLEMPEVRATFVPLVPTKTKRGKRK